MVTVPLLLPITPQQWPKRLAWRQGRPNACSIAELGTSPTYESSAYLPRNFIEQPFKRVEDGVESLRSTARTPAGFSSASATFSTAFPALPKTAKGLANSDVPRTISIGRRGGRAWPGRPFSGTACRRRRAAPRARWGTPLRCLESKTSTFWNSAFGHEGRMKVEPWERGNGKKSWRGSRRGGVS